VLALGVPRERIIFAHPCKRVADLHYARDAGVQVRACPAGGAAAGTRIAHTRQQQQCPGYARQREQALTRPRTPHTQMTTFDTESELAKVAGAYPGIKLVLRVRSDDPEVRVCVCL
jgi:diaminopimelate decarboxylase